MTFALRRGLAENHNDSTELREIGSEVGDPNIWWRSFMDHPWWRGGRPQGKRAARGLGVEDGRLSPSSRGRQRAGWQGRVPVPVDGSKI